MQPRSHQSPAGIEESLISRLCAAMGLTTQSKRASRSRLLEHPERLEARLVLSATGSSVVQLSSNFPIGDPAPHLNIQGTVVDVDNQTFSVPENTVAGTVVGTVVAFDPDTLTPLSYAITSGNSNSAFAINPVTGKITVANTAALNFEAQTTFALTVTVTDSTLPLTFDSAIVTINVTNVNEPTSIVINQTPIAYQIGSQPLIVDPTALVIPDPDTVAPSYKNAKLTVGVAGPQLSSLDVIRVVSQGDGPGQIRVTKSQIYYQGVAVASYRGGRNVEPRLSISFYSTGTNQALQAILRQIAFNTKTHTNPAPNRVLNFTLTNVGGQNAPVVSRTVQVTRP